MKPILQRLIVMIILIFMTQIAIMVVVLYLVDLRYSYLANKQLRNRLINLDSVVYEELALQAKLNNEKARDLLIFDIIESEKLLFASFLLKNNINHYLINNNWTDSCSLKNYMTYKLCFKKDEEIVVGIIPIKDHKNLYGYLIKEALIKNIISNKNYEFVFYIGITLFFVFLCNVLGIIIYFRRYINKDIRILLKSLEILNRSSLNKQNHKKFKNKLKIKEYSLILDSIIAAWNQRKDIEKEKRELYADIQKSKVATQVAHDIRSPLAALNMATMNLPELPEDKRILIRSAVHSIDDIANDLACRDKDKKENNLDDECSVQLLSFLIESLISEKRMQFRSKLGVKIESNLDKSSYGLFAKIQPVQFKRALSNLINNSVEAMDCSGNVTVNLKAKETNIKLIVSDNGKGIPKDILPKLMQKGNTFGKKDGQGLGLYHARETIESWDGNIHIESQESIGTQVIITLPKQPAPEWFVPAIEINKDSTVVVLDDDNSIHQVWKGRFESAGFDSKNIIHFTGPEEIVEWYRKEGSSSAKATADRRRTRDVGRGTILFLCDYELLGSDKNGLDIIKELGIAENSILVTSRFEEERVRKGCEKLGVKLLPKSLAGFVPISLCIVSHALSKEKSNQIDKQTKKSQDAPSSSAKATADRRTTHYDYVLIDDNDINCSTWKLTAKICNKKIATFTEPKEFFAQLKKFDKKTKIFIDSNLSNGVKGEHIAKNIYKKGFEYIYLTTGSDKSEFPHMPWIKEIVGKTPPFIDKKIN